MNRRVVLTLVGIVAVLLGLSAMCAGGLAWVVDRDPPVLENAWQVPRPGDSFSADGGCCTIPEGRWLVGRDIASGWYTAKAGEVGCYWERRSADDSLVEHVIANGYREPGKNMRVQIFATDVVFASWGCGRWQVVSG